MGESTAIGRPARAKTMLSPAPYDRGPIIAALRDFMESLR
jgi:hypothetical protein